MQLDSAHAIPALSSQQPPSTPRCCCAGLRTLARSGDACQSVTARFDLLAQHARGPPRRRRSIILNSSAIPSMPCAAAAVEGLRRCARTHRAGGAAWPRSRRWRAPSWLQRERDSLGGVESLAQVRRSLVWEGGSPSESPRSRRRGVSPSLVRWIAVGSEHPEDLERDVRPGAGRLSAQPQPPAARVGKITADQAKPLFILIKAPE